jgi:hypothetical protein
MLWLCLWSVCLFSSIEREDVKAWMAWMVVIGNIYRPNHYSSCCCRWAYRTVRWCIGHGTVQCPVRATSADHWGLERLTVEVLCPLAAPDSSVAHRTVQCVLTLQFWLLLFSLYCGQRSWPLLRWLIGQSGAYRRVRWIIAEWLWEDPRAASSRGTVAWAPDNVWCATGCTYTCFCSKLCKVPQLIFFVGLCWTLCTWDKWQLGKLVSPRGLWWTSNTKIDYRKCLSPFPFHHIITTWKAVPHLLLVYFVYWHLQRMWN